VSTNPKHLLHRRFAVGLVCTAAVVDVAGGPSFAVMLLLAAAGAQWATFHCVRERERDEPVFEALLRAEERRLNDELDRRRDW
jgi:hypothetical protein